MTSDIKKKVIPLYHFDKDRTCQALDSNGRSCGKKGLSYMKYHGDGEIYHYHDVVKDDMTWVKVIVCARHWRANA